MGLGVGDGMVEGVGLWFGGMYRKVRYGVDERC